MLWSNILDVVRGSLFVLSHAFGGSLGTAILIGAAAVRVALLPITLRAARRRVRQERILAGLAPQLARINERYATQPARLFAETRKLHSAHGIASPDGRSLIEGAVQLPPAMAVYAAIRGIGTKVGGFLWVADVAKPDRWLTGLAAAVAATVAWVSASSPQSRTTAQMVPVVVSGVITLLVLSHLSAGVALYSIANSVISGAERRLALRSPDDR